MTNQRNERERKYKEVISVGNQDVQEISVNLRESNYGDHKKIGRVDEYHEREREAKIIREKR